MELFDKMFEQISKFFNDFGWKLVLAICVLIIGFFFIRLIIFVLKKILYKTTIDNAVVTFICALLKLILWLILIIVMANLLDVSLNSLLVVLSSAAIAVGLALKDSLANLANGILLIINRPFRRGDYVEVASVTGKIYNIKLLTTEILTVDNKKIVIPNSTIVNNPIINYDSCPTRRLEKKYSVHYDSDMELVEKILMEIAKNDSRVLSYPAPSVFISEHAASSVDFTFRFWVNTSDYWDIYNSLDKIVFLAFKKNNIEKPYQQLDIHVKEETNNEKKDNK